MNPQIRQMGARVVRGLGWKWNDQDCVTLLESEMPAEGTVIGTLAQTEDVPEHVAAEWLEVIWDNGVFNFYRVDDLQLAPSADAAEASTYYALAMQTLAISRANVSTASSATTSTTKSVNNTVAGMCSSMHNNFRIDMAAAAATAANQPPRRKIQHKPTIMIREEMIPPLPPPPPPPPVLISFTSLDNTAASVANNGTDLAGSAATTGVANMNLKDHHRSKSR